MKQEQMESAVEDARLILEARPLYDADNNPDPWMLDEDVWAACRRVARAFIDYVEGR